LFINLSHLTEEELARATSWLSMYGQHVAVLVIQEDPEYMLGWPLSAASALHRLQRLEVSETLDASNLEHLALALQQVPQLQHLAVTLEMNHLQSQDHGVFLVSADLRALCPQLTSLALTIHAEGPGMRMDPAVSQLFSRGLQQLTVVDAERRWHGPVLCASSLAHLSALRQLTLDGVQLELEEAGEAEEEDWEEAEDSEEAAQQELERTQQQQQAARAAALAQQLGALQQLRLYHLRLDLQEDAADLVALAPYLVEYEVGVTCQDVSILSSCVHLTRLVLYGDKPQGLKEALASLTGLQELGMQADMGRSTAVALQQAASMPNLRSLQLVGCCTANVALAFAVWQCTQLTSLVLFVGGLFNPDADPWVATLQQLKGLRCLSLPEARLKYERGSWLSHLTALTCLCVELSRGSRDVSREGYQAKAQQLIAGVEQQWPAQLRQVMFWVDPRGGRYSFQPMVWQFTPPAPGSAAVTAWLEEPDGSAAGWSRPLRPCPHLPGVWELQGEVAPEGRAWYHQAD
jgi:hypothetical protein